MVENRRFFNYNGRDRSHLGVPDMGTVLLEYWLRSMALAAFKLIVIVVIIIILLLYEVVRSIRRSIK